MEKKSVYQIVNDQIIDILKSGSIPWEKPWHGGTHGEQKNLDSGKAYNGFNQFLTGLVSAEKQYTTNYWLTFNQAKKRGGQVRKGERGVKITYFKFLEKERINSTGDTVTDKIPLLRYYTVFNCNQIDGIEYPTIEIKEIDFRPIDKCEEIVNSMPKQPLIKHTFFARNICVVIGRHHYLA